MLFRPEINGAADVEAESVKAEFGNFVGSGVEVVARIESIITQELPSAGVILLGSRLNDSGHSRGRRQAVFRAVVRGHLPEFGDGIEGGHHVGATGAAAVVALGTVQ